MPRPSKTEQELGYLKSFWTEVRTLEAEYRGLFSMFVGATPRPGVMEYRMVFTPLMGNVENGMEIDALTFLYPNVEQSSYAGTLWRKSISLSRMVHLRDEEKRARRNNGV